MCRLKSCSCLRHGLLELKPAVPLTAAGQPKACHSCGLPTQGNQSVLLPCLSRPLLSNGNPRTSKTSLSSNRLLKFCHLHDFWGVDALKDELSHAVVLLYDEIHITVVKQQDLNLSSVIGVDNACAGVDEVLCRKSRSWCNPTVCLSISFRILFGIGWRWWRTKGGEEKLTSSSRDSHSQIRIHQSLSSRWDNCLLGRIKIVTRCKRTSSRWQLSFLGKLLNQEVWAVLHLRDWHGDVERLGGGCWDHGCVFCG